MTESLLLFRQVHPAFVQNGHVLYPAFRPTKKDEKRLSVSDGTKITPQAVWERFTVTLGYHSCGVLGVTKLECETCNLSVDEAPVEGQPDHMVIDFTPLSSKGDIDRAAKRLCQVCNQPGLVVS
ncbi:MAG: hypothetical protein FWC43_13530, partial [Planctomycetaceae bacterium]|nr:hypothetical protein [Planctomycetaceae bacterium]